MKDIIPPYGVILRDAIKTGDPELMKAYQVYSSHMMKKLTGMDIDHLKDWIAAHDELSKAG